MPTKNPAAKAAQNRRYYLRNGKEVIRDKNLGYRQRNKTYVDALRSEPCTDCRLRWPVCVMQFDHVGTDKKAAVSEMVRDAYSLESIAAEIAKCELVCSNCHAIRTENRRHASHS